MTNFEHNPTTAADQGNDVHRMVSPLDATWLAGAFLIPNAARLHDMDCRMSRIRWENPACIHFHIEFDTF